jgi:N-methylhydantoinase A
MPGLFSAFGLLVGDTEHHISRSLRLRLTEKLGAADIARVQALLDTLAETGAARLREDGFSLESCEFRLSASARYVGQSTEIPVFLEPAEERTDAAALLSALPEQFASEHERTYGFRAPPNEPVELMGLAMIARFLPDRPRLPAAIPPASVRVPASRRAWFPGQGWVETKVLDRAGLAGAASPRPGPLIIQEYDATCLVPPGASAVLDSFGNICLELSG